MKTGLLSSLGKTIWAGNMSTFQQCAQPLPPAVPAASQESAGQEVGFGDVWLHDRGTPGLLGSCPLFTRENLTFVLCLCSDTCSDSSGISPIWSHLLLQATLGFLG